MGGLHPAVGRSGYCEFHYGEYGKAMSAYRSAKHSFQKGVGNDPGGRDAFEATIQFTPLDDVWTAVSPEDRARIRAQVVAESAAIGFLPDFALSEKAFYETSEPEFRRMVATLLRVHTETVRLLQDLGEEPLP